MVSGQPSGIFQVAGMLGQHIVCERFPVIVEFDTHPHPLAVGEDFVLLLVQLIGLQKLNREFVVVVVVDHPHDDLAIAGQGLDEQSLSIDEVHLAIDRAISQARPASPGVLHDGVAHLVECPVLVFRFNLEIYAPLTDHIGLEEVEITPRILIVSR